MDNFNRVDLLNHTDGKMTALHLFTKPIMTVLDFLNTSYLKINRF